MSGAAPGVAYRPDIDGLRAVAVLSVVVYHLGMIGLVPGGFTGVDVFFVISGFLITGIIARERAAGTFSLVGFYRRRARRILPALTLMLVGTTLAAGVILFQPDLTAYRDSMLAAIFFGANIYFWKTSDYFAAPSGELPLLHTWSLGVEEQYYVVFPLLVLALGHWRPRLFRALVVVGTLGSFALCWWQVRTHPVSAFYLLPPRAWELGAGAALALGVLPAVRRAVTREVVGLAGALGIAAGVLLLDTDTPFPGPAALLPVLGAVLVLHAGPLSLVGRGLSLRPMRFVGTVSYSLYLWHWPVLVLYRAAYPGDFSLLEKVWLFAVAFGLSVASWWLVEQPLRHLSLPRARHVVAFTAGVVAAGVTVALAVVPAAAERPDNVRVAPVLTALAVPTTSRRGVCFLSKGYDAGRYRSDVCLDRRGARPDLLLMGDSHAGALYAGVASAFQDYDVLQATATGCKPLLPLRGTARCTEVLRVALADLQRRGTVDTVVVTARWRRADLQRLPAMLELLGRHARRVVVLGPTWEYDAALPRLLARGMVTGNPGLASQNLDRERFRLDAAMARLVPTLGAGYVSQLSLLCPGQVCPEWAPGQVPMKFDYGHLTDAGSRFTAGRLRPAILAARTSS